MQQKLNQIKQDEKGSALVVTLMVFVVLSVLSASLAMVTMGSHNLAVNTQESTSAYYIAEAGANMAYEEIKSQVKDIHEGSDGQGTFFEKISGSEGLLERFQGKIYSDVFATQNGVQPTATISVEIPVEETNPREYKIISTGDIGGHSRTVEKKITVAWPDSNGIKVPEGASIVAKDSVKYMGGSIFGDIYLNSKEKNSFHTVNQSLNLPTNIYSNYPGTPMKDIFHGTGGDVERTINKLLSVTTYLNMNSINWNDYENYIDKLLIEIENFETITKDFTNNGSEKKIELDENFSTDNLLFQGQITIDVKDKHRIISTDTFKQNWGNTKVVGEGSLTIVVMDTVTFNGPLNTNQGNLRVVFPHKNQVIKISNGSNVNAQIIAPYSEVILENNGIHGSVVAKSAQLSNSGGILRQEDYNFSGDNSAGPSELISTSPAVEP